MRRRDDHDRRLVRRDLPPAIRPGLHCGGWFQGVKWGGAVVFPRPSGRGSIAAAGAARMSWTYRIFPRPSGRGSIAAMVSCTSPVATIRLPPAIRPGLHCGAGLLVREDIAARLPPAIRPGLHCGSDEDVEKAKQLQLPPAIRPGLHCGTDQQKAQIKTMQDFPRPSGRGSIAAPCRRASTRTPSASFPRPSGRGSIAAA